MPKPDAQPDGQADGQADGPPRADPQPARLRAVQPVADEVDEAGDPAGGVMGALEFLRRRLAGDYEVDDFGFDRELTEAVLLPALRPLYSKWFRTEVTGAENIPETGGALLVGNHAGGLWALDAVMVSVAVHDESATARFLRLLGADLVFNTPVIGPLARKTGSTLACNPDAERLLADGELVGVFPEGFKGIGKPFTERYKLQRFGRGGFVTAALQAGVPIIPVSIVGSEEIHPLLGNAKLLARLFNLPYFPLTPTFPWFGPLGLVPLPSKWHIEFGAPIDTMHYGPAAADDPMLVFELTDRVRETIQSTLYRLLARRSSPWR
jgi:1-acyl-sn-glycerol-3-phosphate acyltransferase